MNNQQFLKDIENTFKECLELVRKKNADYANFKNPFKNFESASVVGVDVKRAILVRVLDKISRISNLIEREAVVKDEKLEDTLLDCINYLAILKANIENESNN